MRAEGSLVGVFRTMHLFLVIHIQQNRTMQGLSRSFQILLMFSYFFFVKQFVVGVQHMILTFASHGQSHTYICCDFYCFFCSSTEVNIVDCILLVFINQQHTIRSANCLVFIFFSRRLLDWRGRLLFWPFLMISGKHVWTCLVT